MPSRITRYVRARFPTSMPRTSPVAPSAKISSSDRGRLRSRCVIASFATSSYAAAGGDLSFVSHLSAAIRDTLDAIRDI